MPQSGNFLFDQLLVPIVLWIFILTGIVGVVLGVGLNVRSAQTLRFLGKLNRWVSVREHMKPMDEQHDIGEAVYGHRRWFGAAFAVGGAFAVFMLLSRVNVKSLVAALSRDTPPIIVELAVQSLKWILVTGGVVAMIIGVMLVVSSDALRSLEGRVNQWYSPRQLGKGADTMHLTLDQWVEAYPRAAGVMLAVGAAIVVVASMIVWLGN